MTDGTSKTLVAAGETGSAPCAATSSNGQLRIIFNAFSAATTSSNGRLLATGNIDGVRHFLVACWVHYKLSFRRL